MSHVAHIVEKCVVKKILNLMLQSYDCRYTGLLYSSITARWAGTPSCRTEMVNLYYELFLPYRSRPSTGPRGQVHDMLMWGRWRRPLVT